MLIIPYFSIDFYTQRLYCVKVIKVIYKSFRYRLYPTPDQEKILASHFGQARFVYNYFLRKRIDFYAENKGKKKRYLNYHDTAKMLTELKRNHEFIWLKESNAQSLQQSLRYLDSAYSHFFNDRFKFPAFKKKSRKQSISIPQNFSIDAKAKTLSIPKLNPIKIILHRPIEGAIKSVTVSKTSSGRYFASILCEVKIAIKPKRKGSQIGIDLGLKSFAVVSNGLRIEAPQVLRRSESKLKRLQRLFARKIKGSKNREEARIKVANIHEKISNQRNDFLHKLSHRLVGENQAIFAENLHVKGMMANHFLAKSISDAGWSEFVRQIKYKSEWNGVHFGQIDRFFPSSKRHIACGWINETLTLADREWSCQGCGVVVDRDLNAAQNILQFGILSVGRDAPKLERPGRPRAIRRVAELGSPSL